MQMALFLALVATAVAGLAVFGHSVGLKREAYLREYRLPQGLFAQLRKRRPELTDKDCQLVATALRQFFLAYLKSGCSYVSMPSQVVDDLWHEFILHTRAYEAFCRGAFGQFLHHTPAVALKNGARSDEGLRRVWWQCCREDGMNPRRATRLPLLFAIDAKLKIADGFHYVLDCDAVRRIAGGRTTGVVHCGGEFMGVSAGDAGGAANPSGGDGDGSCGGGGCSS